MTQVTWFARLVMADGSPAVGVPVQLQVFDLTAGWTTIGDGATKADGRVRGTAGNAGPATGPAPMLRLMEADATPAVLGGVPTVTTAGSPPALTADFGELTYIPDRFTALRASPVRMGMASATIAGVAAPAAAREGLVAALAGRGTTLDIGDIAVARDLQTRLTAREADLVKVQSERDAATTLLNTRAAEIKAAQVERDDAKAQASARVADVQRLQVENAAVKADLATNTAAVKAAQVERDDARAQVSARVADVQRLQVENSAVKADLATNTAAVKAVQAERDDAKAQAAARAADIQTLQVENASVRSDLSANVATIKAAQGERDDARAQLAARADDIRRLQAENAAIKAGAIGNSDAIRAVQAERDDATALATTRAADIQRLQGENASVKADLAAHTSAIRSVQAERDDARAQLAARADEVARVQVDRDAVAAKLAAAEKRLADIRVAAPTDGAASVARVSVGDFATNLGDQIDNAQVRLKDRGFSLGAISVTARGLVDDGGKITFPGRDDKTIPAGTLSDIGLQYHPSPVADAAGTGVLVPDVRQLTESAARRVLASVGLVLEVTQGPREIDPTCAEGQVMVQAPPAGQRAPRGTRIIAVFSRKADI